MVRCEVVIFGGPENPEGGPSRGFIASFDAAPRVGETVSILINDGLTSSFEVTNVHHIAVEVDLSDMPKQPRVQLAVRNNERTEMPTSTWNRIYVWRSTDGLTLGFTREKDRSNLPQPPNGWNWVALDHFTLIGGSVAPASESIREAVDRDGYFIWSPTNADRA